MNTAQKKTVQNRERRRKRVRARIHGTALRPRLSVFRSLRSMLVQLIDDAAGKTLVSFHSKTSDMKGDAGGRIGKVAEAYLLGKAVAAAAKEQNIDAVIFDRGAYRYHGRVQAVADGARDGGLSF